MASERGGRAFDKVEMVSKGAERAPGEPNRLLNNLKFEIFYFIQKTNLSLFLIIIQYAIPHGSVAGSILQTSFMRITHHFILMPIPI